MKEKNYTGIIPSQQEGFAIDTESSVELNSVNEAIEFFQTVKKRLLDVNNWQKIAGKLTSEFQLVDEKGQSVSTEAREGMYFRIDIPGPGSKSGEGFDWVKIEAIEEYADTDCESLGIRVRPVSNPFSEKKEISHFYSEESTSSFTVTRESNTITAAIYDRNTKPNKEGEDITGKIRDAMVGTAGIIAFSKIQWKSLTDGLIKKNSE